MSASAPTAPTARRQVKVSVRDMAGQQMPFADIEILVAGKEKGHIFTGSEGLYSASVRIQDSNAVVEINVTVSGVTQGAYVSPGSDEIQFDFAATPPIIKSVVPAVPTCPDGTTGFPCVTCRDGSEEWELCT